MTTEQLAHPGGGEPPRPVYPGEATADDTREEGRDEMREEADVTDVEEAAYGEGPAAEETAAVPQEEAEALLPEQEAEEYRKTWGEIQARFVDDPRGAVRDADRLVAEVMQTLAGTFSEHKRELESQWQEGEQVATEDLRLALQRYRSFFGQLLRT
ncbi:hypothetical protein MTF65_03535 [Streptomyces sp. APSN-46.1]|uniref:hypothetical protein n=1 Tax=Streptomyces sp. APSN-46.1 TaxID=2929049 RepID=UPI001FB4FF10|nr:hypothetical protein [Streptomyces sp. APSN-46.1]MCJ1676436.1 hypothetical protein [Streptomyces sp. APSN-46.1]